MNAMAPWLDARRAQAAQRFRAEGVPHRRIEAWKYSDLRASLNDEQVERADIARWSVGRRSEGLELFDLGGDAAAPGWVVRNLGVHNDGAMAAASLAFSRGGFALRVPRGTSGAIDVGFPTSGQARILLVVEDGASLEFLETGAADVGDLRNIGMEFVLCRDARLTHTRLQPASPGAVLVTDVSASLERGARYRLHDASFGAAMSRLELNILLNGEEAQADLSGVAVLGDGLHSDVTTHIVHAAGNTRSTQLFKNVAGGRSRAIYQGKITVRHGANGSDSRQTAKALLLGAQAEADLKPELEILADDVKCAHGAAVGELDAEAMFYLRSRGVPEPEARNLLIHAFLEEAVDTVSDDAIRASILEAIEAELPRAVEAGP